MSNKKCQTKINVTPSNKIDSLDSVTTNLVLFNEVDNIISERLDSVIALIDDLISPLSLNKHVIIHGASNQLDPIGENIVNHKPSLEAIEVLLLHTRTRLIPSSKHQPLLTQSNINDKGNGSTIGMKHDKVFFLGCVKDQRTNKITITNFKIVIEFAHILAFPRHLHKKSNKNLSLRQNLLLRLQS